MQRILQKSQGESFHWLNSKSLIDSRGYKFELYLAQEEVSIQGMVGIFYKLFSPFISGLQIGMLPPNSTWGDFCIDTWNMQSDTYDYSPHGKSKETALYLHMLEDNNIEPSYQGLCTCQNWNQFLPIVLDCIMTCRAPYSIICYCPSYEFMFYFHHTGSLGIYYKQFNDAIMHILQQAKAAQLELWNWNDEESLARLRGDFNYRGKARSNSTRLC